MYHKKTQSVHWVKTCNVQRILGTGEFWVDERHLQTENDESLRELKEKINLNKYRQQQLRDLAGNGDDILAARAQNPEVKVPDCGSQEARAASAADPGDEIPGPDDNFSQYENDRIDNEIYDLERTNEGLRTQCLERIIMTSAAWENADCLQAENSWVCL